MPIPRVAIVGRPNAGKSSLMNMIAGAKVSIVDPTPGVTRDRVATIVDIKPPDMRLLPKPVEFIDTGGFGVYTAEGGRFDEVGADLSRLTQSIEFQIEQAVESADLILFAIDCQQGVTPADEQIAQLLRAGGIDRHNADHRKRVRRTNNPEIRVVATKCDGPRWEAHAYEAAGLGFGEPLMCSAKNNYMRREFMDSIYNLLPDRDPDQKRPHADLMLAIIGKRNAGKSTLVNTLAGEERVIVSEIAGTTRDAVDVRFEMDGRSLVAIDTAGLRRKKSFQDAIEHYAFDRAQRAVERADVILLLLDATEKISQVDEQLAALAQKSYKPTIVVVTKWDEAEGRSDFRGRPATPERYEEYIRKELRAMWFAPISFIAGKTGRNVKQTISLAFEMKQQSEERVTTGKLNRLVRAIIDTRGPTDTVGTQAKVYYVAQTGMSPPTITLVVNHPELFRPNYIRFLMNRFREELPFKEIPMRIVVRARRQRESDLGTASQTEDDSLITVKRGTKGGDTLARRRTQELVDSEGSSRGSIPGDAELLAQFDSDLKNPANGAGDEALDGDEAALAAKMLEDTEEFDTGYDEAVESGDLDSPADRGPRSEQRDNGEYDDEGERDERPRQPARSAATKPQRSTPAKDSTRSNSRPARPQSKSARQGNSGKGSKSSSSARSSKSERSVRTSRPTAPQSRGSRPASPRSASSKKPAGKSRPAARPGKPSAAKAGGRSGKPAAKKRGR